MNNIYTIIENDKFYIKKEIENITNKYKDIDYVEYDCYEASSNEILLDIFSDSLFASEKIICLQSFELIIKDIMKDSEYKHFLKFLQHNDSSNILIFVINNYSINEVTRLLEENSVVVKKRVIDINQIKEEVNQKLKEMNVKIENKYIEKLINYNLSDISGLFVELEKIISFQKTEILDDNSFDELYDPPFEEKGYELTKAYINGDRIKAIRLYEELLFSKIPGEIFSSLYNSINEIIMTKVLMRNKVNETDMSTYLRLRNPKQLYYKKLDANKFNDFDIIKRINHLHQLDIDRRTKNIDEKLLIELFLMKG